uniref:Uncharacterized protein n=1 Tax=Geospiza parvula TaxID=87175 RepID=A0A8C3Q881_GEOPR
SEPLTWLEETRVWVPQRSWRCSHCILQENNPLQCQDLLVQNALFTGDLDMVRKYFTKSSAINLIIETRGDVLRWTSSKRGLWSLSYEQELTTPLHITAGRGYTECLRLLLLRGAAVDLAPGGRTALHEACAAASAACARLLLCAGADPEAVSEQGYRPLHLCKSSDSIGCVQQLLQHGASVNSQTEEEQDTALHVASRHGLAEHVQLLLRHGARLDVRNKEGQTPLNAACAQQHQPQDMDRYYRVCQLGSPEPGKSASVRLCLGGVLSKGCTVARYTALMCHLHLHRCGTHQRCCKNTCEVLCGSVPPLTWAQHCSL